MSALLLILAFALPALAGIALCVGGMRATRVAVPVSLVTSCATVVLAVGVAISRPNFSVPFVAGGRFGLKVDGLSAIVVPMVTVIGVLVLVFAAAEGTKPAARFHGLMLLFIAAVIVTATATTLPALLAAWEIMGATSYALIGFHWRDPARVNGGFTAFLVTRSADLGLYVAAGAAIAGNAGLTLDGLGRASSPWLDVIAAGVLVAGLGKAAQLPFSFWLSRAMEGPSPVSALLHSAAMVAMGGYLLLRLHPLLAATQWAGATTAWIGVTTAIMLGLVAVAQRDLKQVLAASTASQLGFVVLAAGVGSIAGGTSQLVAHAATKALLFLVAGAWLAATGTKQLGALRGIGRRWRFVGATFVIGILSLAGIPPFALWLSKDSVLAGALEASPALYVAGLVAAALSAAYAGKILAVIWKKPTGSEERQWDDEQAGTRRINRGQKLPLAILAAVAVLLPVFALPPLSTAFTGLLAATGEPSAGSAELAASAILAIIVVALVAWRGNPTLLWFEKSWFANWLGLERAANALIAHPVLAASDLLSRLDDELDHFVDRTGSRVLGSTFQSRFDYGLDRFVDRSAGLALGSVPAAGPRPASAADDAAMVERTLITPAVSALARWAAALGRVARKPQSGRIDDYYLLATVVIAAAAVLLIVVR